MASNQQPAPKPKPSTSAPEKRPQQRPGFLAQCPSCRFTGANLLQCIKCNVVFTENVNLVPDPFYKSPHRNPMACSVKQEPGQECVKSEPTAIKEEVQEHADEQVQTPLSSRKQRRNTVEIEKDLSFSENFEKDPGEPEYEKRLRMLHVGCSRPPMSQIGMHSDSVTYRASCSIQDTIIEEEWHLDSPISLKIVKFAPEGANQIFNQTKYSSTLRKIVFSSPSPIDFIRKLLDFAINTKKLRFGTRCFHLCNNEVNEISVPVGPVKAKNVECLDLIFDKVTYASYTEEEKIIMRSKISKFLQIASVSFPKLKKCDIGVPDDLEADLDVFLEAKPDLKKRGCKQQIFKDNIIRFTVDDENKTESVVKQVGNKVDKRRDSTQRNQSQPSSTQPKPSKTLAPVARNVEIIELSDSDDEMLPIQDPIPLPQLPSNESNKCAEQVMPRRSPSPPLIWNEEKDSEEFIPGFVAPCSKCGNRSRNLRTCDKCKVVFPPSVKPIAVKPSFKPSSTTNLEEKLQEEGRPAGRLRFMIGYHTKCTKCHNKSEDLINCTRCKTPIPQNCKPIWDPKRDQTNKTQVSSMDAQLRSDNRNSKDGDRESDRTSRKPSESRGVKRGNDERDSITARPYKSHRRAEDNRKTEDPRSKTSRR